MMETRSKNGNALSPDGYQPLEDAALGPAEGLPRAEKLLLDWLARNPPDARVLQLLGNVYIRTQRYQDAENHLSEAVRLAPDLSSARWMLAGSFYQRAQWEKALPHLDILLGQEPENYDYLNLQAYSLLNVGEYQSAVSVYESLLEKRPSAEAWMLYGYALATVGRRAEAEQAYREAIRLKPDYGEAYWSLANLKTFQFSASDLVAMRQCLGRVDMPVRSRAQMQFALGKALEDATDYASSFEEYRKGNAVWRQTIQHNADGVSDFVSRARALYTPAFFASRADQGCPSADPIFIVGLPRSGSTLLEQILASHSMIEGTRELPTLNNLAKQLIDYEHSRSRYPERLADIPHEQLRALGEEYLAQTRVHRKLDRRFFIDKTPSNFHHLGLISLVLPNAKIVDARRHPLGAGFAIFKQYFPHGHSFAFDLTEIGRYYRDYVELMAHFDAVLPGRVHRVCYEALVGDPETEIRRLLEYVGVPFEPTCLRFNETERAVLTPSAEQVRRPIYKDAVEHWRHFEPWLAPLRSALGEVLTVYPEVPRFPTLAAQAAQPLWRVSGAYRFVTPPS